MIEPETKETDRPKRWCVYQAWGWIERTSVLRTRKLGAGLSNHFRMGTPGQDHTSILVIDVTYLQPSLTSVCPTGWAQIKQLRSGHTRARERGNPGSSP